MDVSEGQNTDAHLHRNDLPNGLGDTSEFDEFLGHEKAKVSSLQLKESGIRENEANRRLEEQPPEDIGNGKMSTKVILIFLH